jgi:hypothetical protein
MSNLVYIEWPVDKGETELFNFQLLVHLSEICIHILVLLRILSTHKDRFLTLIRRCTRVRTSRGSPKNKNTSLGPINERNTKTVRQLEKVFERHGIIVKDLRGETMSSPITMFLQKRKCTKKYWKVFDGWGAAINYSRIFAFRAGSLNLTAA